MRTVREFLRRRMRVLVGDITTWEGGAIVNAANSGLSGGGGVDGAIHAAGGPEILEACRTLRATSLKAGLPAGAAVASCAGKLHAARVIHTVGPVWAGGGSGEAETLASCYREALRIAAGEGLRTIAFPAVSTGVYGYPRKEAARVAFEAVSRHLEAQVLPERVDFVFFSVRDADDFLAGMGADSMRAGSEGR
ncbi:MAG: O-acetyl-ADP-ribose deacetylase [Rectinemataceae bacterium]